MVVTYISFYILLTDSDIPTKGRTAVLSDSDGEDNDTTSRSRQRLPSDSGSDPEAVRATAEDIFGEADDISDDEKDKEEEVSLSGG